MKRVLIFWELHDSSMSFTSIIPNTSHHKIHKYIFRNTTHFTQYNFLQHDIPVPKGVTPFARTAPSWKRAFPGTPGMHMIELMVHNQNTLQKPTKFT